MAVAEGSIALLKADLDRISKVATLPGAISRIKSEPFTIHDISPSTDEEVTDADHCSPLKRIKIENGSSDYCSTTSRRHAVILGQSPIDLSRALSNIAQRNSDRSGALNGQDIPLARNPDGSLLELACKLRWAEQAFMKDKPAFVKKTIPFDNSKENTYMNSTLSYNASRTPHVTEMPYCSSQEPSYSSTARSDCSDGNVVVASPSTSENRQCLLTKESTIDVMEDEDNNHDVQLIADKQPSGEQEKMHRKEFFENYRKYIKLLLNKNASKADLPTTSVEVCHEKPNLWPVLTSFREITNWDYESFLRELLADMSHSSTKASTGVDNEESPTVLNDEADNGHDEVTDSQEGHNNGENTCNSDFTLESKISNYMDKMTKSLEEDELIAIQESAITALINAKMDKGTAKYPGDPLYGGSSMKGFLQKEGRDGEGYRKHHCSFCNYQTDNKSHLRRHLSSVHAIGMVYYCYVCNKDFPRSEKVKAHFLKVHPDVAYDSRLVRKDKRPDDSPPKRMGGFVDVQAMTHSVEPLNLVLETAEPAYNVDGKEPNGHNINELAFSEYNSPVSSPSPSGQDSQEPNGSPEEYPGCPMDFSPSNIDMHSPGDGAKKKKSVVCPTCSYIGRDIWHLKRHMADVHSQNRAHKCPQCDYATSRKHRLLSHMKNHGALFCVHCCMKVGSVTALKQHLSKCPGSNFPCSRCGQSFKNRAMLQNHLFLIHGVTIYTCDSCFYLTETQDSLEKHRNAAHSDEAPTPLTQDVEKSPLTQIKVKLNCKHCGDGFMSKKELVEHSKSCEESQDQFTCSICKYSTQSRKVMEMHLSRLHSDNTVDAEMKNSTAIPPEGATDQATDQATDLSLGEEDIDAKKKNMIACDVAGCDFRTSWMETLESHKNLWHSPVRVGKGTFICPICKDCRPPFRYKRSFDKHMEQHEQEAEKCPLCPKVFYFRHDMKKHLQLDHSAEVEEVSTDDYSSSGDEDAETSRRPVSSLPQLPGTARQGAACPQQQTSSLLVHSAPSKALSFNLPKAASDSATACANAPVAPLLMDCGPPLGASSSAADIMFVCPMCAKVFLTMSTFGRHLAEQHSTTVATPT